MENTKKEIVIERQPVISKIIKSIGYDRESQTVEVEFNTGSIYRYTPVAPDTYMTVITGESVGGEFNRLIKPHVPYTKIK